MSRLSLDPRELDTLRVCLFAAIEGACIPDWEFEPLIGCSRRMAARSARAYLRSLASGRERQSGQLQERVVLLLSVLHGASATARTRAEPVRGLPELQTDQLAALIARLTVEEPTTAARTSGIGLRKDASAPRTGRRRAL